MTQSQQHHQQQQHPPPPLPQQQQQQQQQHQGPGGPQLQQQPYQPPLPLQHQQGGNGNGNGVAANGGGSQDAASSAQPEYTLAGILHYLQSEWRRYEKDRNEWEIERAEMRARIALLEGERRAVENLKTDLMRRVKMLEYALRQERSKYLSGATAGQTPIKNPALASLEKEMNLSSSGRSSPARLDDADLNGSGVQRPGSVMSVNFSSIGGNNNTLNLGTSTLGGAGATLNLNSLKQRNAKDLRSREKSRDYLKQCLQEITYLTSATTLNPLPDRAAGSVLHGTNQLGPLRPRKTMPEDLQGPDGAPNRANRSGTGTFLATRFGGLTQDPVAEGDEADQGRGDIDGDAAAAGIGLQRPGSPQPYATDALPDAIAADAEFRPTGGADDWQLLKEAGEAQRAKRERERKRQEEQGTLLDSSQSGIMRPDNVAPFDSEAVGDDSLSEEANAAMEESRLWKLKKTLALHRGPITVIAFDGIDLAIFSASRDRSVRMARFDAAALEQPAAGMTAPSASKPTKETVTIFSGHAGVVTSLVVSPLRRRLYTGSSDATLRVWKVPDPSAQASSDDAPGTSDDEDSTREGEELASIATPSEIVHLTLLPSPAGEDAILASASTDGIVRFYAIVESIEPMYLLKFDYFGRENDATDIAERAEAYRQQWGGLPTPTSLCSIPSDLRRCAVSYSNDVVKVFEVHSGREVGPRPMLPSARGNVDDAGPSTTTQINALVAHPTLPLIFTGHEDKFIRVCDLNTRECILMMQAHKDAISSIDVDPAGLKLVTAGHDGAVRIWDIVSLSRKFTDSKPQEDGASDGGGAASNADESRQGKGPQKHIRRKPAAPAAKGDEASSTEGDADADADADSAEAAGTEGQQEDVGGEDQSEQDDEDDDEDDDDELHLVQEILPSASRTGVATSQQMSRVLSSTGESVTGGASNRGAGTGAGAGVLVVRYHPNRPFFACAGAEGLVRIYG